jgi:hypothetical protein
MKQFLKSKKGIVLLATMIVAVVAAVGAYAWFTNGGTGTQQNAADVGTAGNNNWTVVTDYANTTYNQGNALYPTPENSANKSVATVPFSITNNDEATELLTTYTVSIDPTWAAANPTCDPAWFKIGSAAVGNPFTVSGLHVQLAPNSDGGAATYSNTVALELVNFDTNQNGCELTTPQLKITASS